MYLQHKHFGTIVEIPAKPVVDSDGCMVGGPSYLDAIKSYTVWDDCHQTLNPDCPTCHGTGVETGHVPGIKAEGSCLPCAQLHP